MSLAINYVQSADENEAFQRAKAAISTEAIAKYQVQADIEYKEESKSIVAMGKGFKLILDFDKRAAKVSIELAFLLKPLKNKILSSIEKQLKEVL